MSNYVKERMIQLLQERHLNGYTVAKMCDIPRSTLNNYLNGKTIPTVIALEQFCKGMNIDVMEFYDPQVHFSHERKKAIKYLRIIQALKVMPTRDKQAFYRHYRLLCHKYRNNEPINHLLM